MALVQNVKCFTPLKTCMKCRRPFPPSCTPVLAVCFKAMAPVERKSESLRGYTVISPALRRVFRNNASRRKETGEGGGQKILCLPSICWSVRSLVRQSVCLSDLIYMAIENAFYDSLVQKEFVASQQANSSLNEKRFIVQGVTIVLLYSLLDMGNRSKNIIYL